MADKHKQHKMLGKGLLGQVPEALQPDSRKEIKQESTRMIRSQYKPLITETRQQEKLAAGIYEKRTNDNQYYLDWLAQNAAQLEENAQSADERTLAAQQQIQAQAQAAMGALSQRLQGTNPGTVSNPAQSTVQTDIAAQNAANQGMIGAARQRTVDEMASAANTRQTGAAANTAAVTAMQNKAATDYSLRRRELGDARIKIKQERRGAINEEITRRLDQEIAKASTVVEMRNMAAQLALGLKQHRLSKAELALNEQIKNAELQLDAQAQAETARHNQATERNADQDRHAENQQNQADQQHEDQQNQQEINTEVHHKVNQAVDAITGSKKFRHLIVTNPQKVLDLMIKNGWEPLYAHIAVAYVSKGHDATRQYLDQLRSEGYTGGLGFLTGD